MSKKAAGGQGSIRKRPDGRWEYRFTDGYDPKTGKQRQRSVYAKTQNAVLEKKRQIEAELDRTGKVINPSSITLEKWLDEWIANYCVNLKPRSIETYQSAIRSRIVPALGKAKLKDLTQKDIQLFINNLAKETSYKTVKNHQGILHKALQKAVDLEYIKKNPANNIQLPAPQNREMHVIPESSLKSFLKLFEGDFFEPVINLALLTGLRQAELLGLSWHDVDFEAKTITVRQQLALVTGQGYFLIPPKHNKTRVVPLTSQALDILKEQKERQEQWQRDSFGTFNNEWGLVFTNELGKHISRNTLKSHYYKCVKDSEFEAIRFHDMRHSCATYLLRAGVDYKTLSELLGHASINFTMSTYAHVTKAMERDAADKLENFFKSLD